MRSSALVLPLMLLMSPGDGTPARSAPPAMKETRTPLPDKRPACPMPVAALPAASGVSRPKSLELPPGSFRTFWDTLDPAPGPSMPVAPAGCWNPLFRKAALPTAIDPLSP